jgi:hypothetical protein
MKGEMTISNCLIGLLGYSLAFGPATEFWGEKLRNLFTKKED